MAALEMLMMMPWMDTMAMLLDDAHDETAVDSVKTQEVLQAQGDDHKGARRHQLRPRSAGGPCGMMTGGSESGAT